MIEARAAILITATTDDEADAVYRAIHQTAAEHPGLSVQLVEKSREVSR